MKIPWHVSSCIVDTFTCISNRRVINEKKGEARREKTERPQRRNAVKLDYPPSFKLFLEGNCWEDGRVDSGRAICTIMELFTAESPCWRRRYRAQASVRKITGTSVLRWPWNVSLAPRCITVCAPEVPLESWL